MSGEMNEAHLDALTAAFRASQRYAYRVGFSDGCEARKEMLDALWACAEHNQMHFGENHSTVIQAREALKKGKFKS